MSLVGKGFYNQRQYAKAHGQSLTLGRRHHWVLQHAEPHWSEGRFDHPLNRREWLRAHPFDPNAKHSPERLDAYATAILSANRLGPGDGILFNEHLIARAKHEVYNAYGVPEPNIVEGMYWRTHKSGRKFNSLEERTANASKRLAFYK